MTRQKGKAVEVPPTAAQKAAAKRAAAQRLEKAEAQRLAQIVNLHIAGLSLAEIGAQIGATADEVDRMLQRDATRYVRTQASLRVYVRNYVSARYTQLLDAVWDEATDKAHARKLENQDRALKILDSMRKLHGADAPVQSEVKVEAAPESVDALVQALSKAQGMGYDANVFDVVDAEVVDEAAEQSRSALLDAAEQVGEGEDGPL